MRDKRDLSLSETVKMEMLADYEKLLSQPVRTFTDMEEAVDVFKQEAGRKAMEAMLALKKTRK